MLKDASHLGNRCPHCHEPAIPWKTKLLTFQHPYYWRANCSHCGTTLRASMLALWGVVILFIGAAYALVRIPGTDRPLGTSPLAWTLVVLCLAAFLVVLSWAYWRFVPLLKA